MVTRNRLSLAERAVRCFAEQSYPNRELVVVDDGDIRCRRALERFAAEGGARDLIRFVAPEVKGLALGALRNLSMDRANGEVLCQWDDDDFSHPSRLDAQMATMLDQDASACYLTDHLQFLEDDNALVWVDWTLGGRAGAGQLLPGTVMMRKDDRFRYPESGASATRGEDSALLDQLWDAVPVASLVGKGYLYLYTYHGRNTFDREHHHRMSLFGRPIADLVRDEEVIRKAMRHYPVPKPYLVVGSDGPAYLLDA